MQLVTEITFLHLAEDLELEENDRPSLHRDLMRKDLFVTQIGCTVFFLR